ncbi:MAG: hypothetical protein A3D67_02695 [Candidatus Lloydbacteria bacterium RIFCSPHIGHO2_02_FULL_51_22]|uniref:Membrane insertase YidC/Oxa/ALB C-terminal domain-containing protein n=1 Tax=Candidatus Lloydbacteria bacterium RIFCSPHIGHO2_02_FULL_51_22 TaxID=1798663 RepID=A0A1G2DB51_9BACT|nr:MAG: hypothetical protein A3D67_02695 [Candidatus Lloydbacteria bacterium RIFCSPHIGHO2_02_FULL_51_22]
MLSFLFNTFIYDPIYNGFVFFVDITPFHNVGLAVIFITILVRLIILPITHKTVRSQAKMKALEPEITRIKGETKHDTQEQTKRVMELYQKHGVNPFSGCLMLIIQTPILLALFWLFNNEISNGFSTERLYSFIEIPQYISLLFLGFIDMSQRDIFLALAAGISQYFQIKLAVPPLPPRDANAGTPSLKDEFARSFQTQTKYVFPVMVFFLSFKMFPSAVALYWATSNLFSIAHELFVRRKAQK